jgi:site-specific DNA-methyltransferase (adenine-specific)
VGTENRINSGGRTGKNPFQSEDTNLNGKANIKTEVTGRFPANLIHDGSDEVVGLFPETSKGTASKRGANRNGDVYGEYGLCDTIRGHNDNGGSASRFFYCAKASKSERGEGNNHPTVKPVKLMKYLITLITPKSGVVLEPFGGSGTTAVGCLETGNPFIIIEREPEYIEIIKKRVQAHRAEPDLFNQL